MYFQLQLWLAFPLNMIIAYCCVCVWRHPCRWSAGWTKATVKGQVTQLFILQLRYLKNAAAVSVHLGKLFLYLSPPGPNCEWGRGINSNAGWQKIPQSKWRLITAAVMGNRCGTHQGRLACQDIWTIKTGTGSPGDCQSHISLLLS